MRTIPSTLSRGIGTSEVTGRYLGLVSEVVNRSAERYGSLLKDRTLTAAQKSPHMADLHRASLASISKQLNKAKDEATLRYQNLDRQADAALAGKLTTVEISQLALQLKAMSADDAIATIQFSPDYARAAALAPPALSGISSEHAGMITFLKHHEPNLYSEIEQVQADLSAIASMDRETAQGLRAIEIRIDVRALEEAYKPDLGALDVEPRPGESLAAYNKRMGKPEQAEEATSAATYTGPKVSGK